MNPNSIEARMTACQERCVEARLLLDETDARFSRFVKRFREWTDNVRDHFSDKNDGSIPPGIDAKRWELWLSSRGLSPDLFSDKKGNLEP